jgi:hypothetical protein
MASFVVVVTVSYLRAFVVCLSAADSEPLLSGRQIILSLSNYRLFIDGKLTTKSLALSVHYQATGVAEEQLPTGKPTSTGVVAAHRFIHKTVMIKMSSCGHYSIYDCRKTG